MQTTPLIRTTLPASDVHRARRFYEETLGFRPAAEDESGISYEGADGTAFFLYPSDGRPSGSHTQMNIVVDDVDAEVADLKSRGVTFETVDMPGYDPDTRMVVDGSVRGAWFRDPEGNLIALSNATAQAS